MSHQMNMSCLLETWCWLAHQATKLAPSTAWQGPECTSWMNGWPRCPWPLFLLACFLFLNAHIWPHVEFPMTTVDWGRQKLMPGLYRSTWYAGISAESIAHYYWPTLRCLWSVVVRGSPVAHCTSWSVSSYLFFLEEEMAWDLVLYWFIDSS